MVRSGVVCGGVVLEDYDPAFTSHSLAVTLTSELTTAQTDCDWLVLAGDRPGVNCAASLVRCNHHYNHIWVAVTNTLSPHNWPRKSQI